jgi:hypothetical protein
MEHFPKPIKGTEDERYENHPAPLKGGEDERME